jgi:hypothetical protein
LFDVYSKNYEELRSLVERNAKINDAFILTTFVEEFSTIAAESGDTSDLFPVEIFHDSRLSYQVDAYNLDTTSGELTLAVADPDFSSELRTFNRQYADKFINRAIRFFKNSKSTEFLENLEESSHAFDLAQHINENINFIKRLRIIFFSSAVSTIQKPLEFETIDGIDYTRNVFDIVRYSNILTNQSSNEDYEIKFSDFDVDGLPVLPASVAEGYKSYMGVMPGSVLAQIYSLYGGKLLEQNVRVFLQARTKVNRGIINTLSNKPDHFFAYNNGLTVTAKEITLDEKDGIPVITSAKNLQIVNGGQTTASVLYARDREKADLSRVSIQMKLNVTDLEASSELVKNISRYSNSQNVIREADFFSTHAFHIYMEKASQRIETPRGLDTGVRTKWFYERARGQYKDRQAYMTPKKRDLFLAEYPRSQLIDKTNLAKYWMSAERKPYLVSRGAQKCFLAFADKIEEKWSKNEAQFNDVSFKEFISKAILFKSTDKAIANSDWYKENRGYKAEIVTYTVSLIMENIHKNKLHFDFDKIWNKQVLDEDQLKAIVDLGSEVRLVLLSPPSTTSNIREYCKKEICWKDIKNSNLNISNILLNSLSVEKEIILERKRDGKKQGQIDQTIDFDIKIAEIISTKSSEELRSKAKQLKVLDPNSNQALNKLNRGVFNLTYTEKDSLKRMLLKIEETGI